MERTLRALFFSFIGTLGVLSAFALRAHAQDGATNMPPTQGAFTYQPFTDVAATHPNYEAIEYLRTHNIVRGYLDGTFKPDQRITRGEFVKLIMNPVFIQGERVEDCIATYISTGSTVFFPDVPRNHIYANEVCFAKVKDIIHGYPDGRFRLTRPINIAEAAKILSRIFAIQVRRDNVISEGWYTAYIQRLSELHAIPLSLTRLDQPIKRGEMAELAYRLWAKRDDKPSRTWQELLR